MSFTDWWNAVHKIKVGEFADKIDKLDRAIGLEKNAERRNELTLMLRKTMWHASTAAQIRERHHYKEAPT